MNNVTNPRQKTQPESIGFTKVYSGGGESVKKGEELSKKSVMTLDLVLDELSEEVYAELCDDLIFGLILQIHRASKLGYLFYLQPEASNDANARYDLSVDNLNSTIINLDRMDIS